ncbi:MAG TPA: enoyl-CoA hydratase-related protein [Acidimicrobiia bacterium]|jgi:2-(1,2-epoxy-1,2-dihydrophenyl)acetyl-CoA isomerase|nr:enoyl-CoA hydratase-related protein [Acidimicrobiia bacterium]
MSVDYALEDDLAIVTLNRPDRYNAIDASLGEGLIQAASRAGEEARALVLTGAGNAFCSGADLNDLMADYQSGDGPDLARLLEDVFHPALHALLDCEVPVVGAINGVAAGAGLGLALACDLRVMAEQAFLTSAFTAIGLVPDSGTTWWLSHHLGVSRALEITFTNRRVGADEARQLGLCVDVVPGDQLLGRAKALAGQLADLVPDSLVTTRRLIRDASAVSLEEALNAEQTEQNRLGRTPEHREGVMAFIEKRKPDFRA